MFLEVSLQIIRIHTNHEKAGGILVTPSVTALVVFSRNKCINLTRTAALFYMLKVELIIKELSQRNWEKNRLII